MRRQLTVYILKESRENMNSEYNIQIFLTMFYQDSNIPVYIYEKENLQFAWPEQTELTYPPPKYIDFFLQKNSERISYTATEYGAFFACLTLNYDSDCRLIFGPISEIPYSDSELRQIYEEYVISVDNRKEFQDFLWQSPQITLNALLRKVVFVNYCLNKEILSVTSLLPLELSKESTDKSEEVYAQKEGLFQNKSYELEQMIVNFVKSGNPHGLFDLTVNESNIHSGITAPNVIRQLKNNLIVSTTIATRAAIDGGLDTDTAFKMSDEFIQTCERTQNPQTIYELMGKVPYAFAEKVAEAQTPVSANDIIQKAIRFIQQNTNQHITTTDVAEHVQFSRSYFSAYFKQELGFSVGAFITRCKLQEAQRLLQYTNKPLSVISNYLCFSSQSHFQTAFKKQFGMTPIQYRKNPKVEHHKENILP